MSRPVDIISKAVEDKADSLQELSGKIWSHPELCYEEKFAHDTLTEFLEKNGFEVERKYKVDTAFKAVFRQGSGGANIGLICEYDALPDIGHACGHNLIAESGAAAGLGLKAMLQANTSVPGTVTVFGTPAEEGGGGKVVLVDAGAFEEVDICLMAHPGAMNMLAPGMLSTNHGSAVFTGRAAHAAAAPWAGVNALDAAVNAYTSLSMLRQQLHPDWRVHAIITEGGTKPNIIPERTTMKFYVRCPTDKEVGVLKEKVTAVMKAAALSTGCDIEIKYQAEDRAAYYSNLLTNRPLIERYCTHWLSFGPANPALEDDRFVASSDIGNVSYVVPAFQPAFSVGSYVHVHTRQFTGAANKPEAHTATRCVSKAMAAVGWDVLTDGDFRKRVKESFKQQVASMCV